MQPAALWSNIKRKRRYQVAADVDNKEFIHFAPSGEASEYFWNYCNRINGAGVAPIEKMIFLVDEVGARDRVPYFPSARFPGFAFMENIYLKGADLTGLDFEGAVLTNANISESMLQRANLSQARIGGACFSAANMFGAHCIQTEMDGVDVTDANLYGLDLRVTSLESLIGLDQDGLNKTAAGELSAVLPSGLEIPQRWVVAESPMRRKRESPTPKSSIES